MALPFGPGTQTQIRIVDIRTAQDRIVRSGGSYAPIVFAPEGVYVVGARWESPPIGLWLLDPDTGQLRAVATESAWYIIGTGAAWGFTAPPTAIGFYQSERVDRIDLQSGRSQNWYLRPGASVAVIGLDNLGRAVVRVLEDVHTEILTLEAPGRVRLLFRVNNQYEFGGPIFADTHGMWFLTPTGLYLYNDQNGLRRLSEISSVSSADGSTVSALSIAGPCV